MQNPPETPLRHAPAGVPETRKNMNFVVHISPSQRQFETSPDATLLAAAEQAGIALPSSCRNGTCRTCICKLISGSVTYVVQWPGLSLEEKQDGFILPCVARATSDLVVEQAQTSDLWAG
jgi:ferredoxin